MCGAGVSWGARMKRIATAGNTVVPALLVLEQLGFAMTVNGASELRATRGDEEYVADDPVAVLGLVKLIESRTWDWRPTDDEFEATARRYNLLG